MQRRPRYFDPECFIWQNRIVENGYEIQRFQPPDLWQATLRDYSHNETDLKKRENERLKELYFGADNPALKESFRREIPPVIQKRINEHKKCKAKAKKEAEKEAEKETENVRKVRVRRSPLKGYREKSVEEHSRSRSVTKIIQKNEAVKKTLYKDFDDYNRHSRFTKFPSGHSLRIKSQKDLGVKSQKDVIVTPLPRSFLRPSYGQSLQESPSREWPKFPSQLQRVLGKIVVKRYDPQNSSLDHIPPPKESSSPQVTKPPPSPPKPPPEPAPKPKKEPSIPPNLPAWLHELAVRYKGKKFNKLPLWQVLIIALLEEQERLTRKKEKENLNKKLKKKATLESLIRQQRYEENINAITRKIKRSITPFVRTSIMKNKHSAYRH